MSGDFVAKIDFGENASYIDAHRLVDVLDEQGYSLEERTDRGQIVVK